MKDINFLKNATLLLITLIVGQCLQSQILINEFMASNSSLITDPDYNDNPDWLELYNSGDVAVNLNGYYLTDNLSNPDKWQISIDTVLNPKAYIVIWTDDQDTMLHTSFKLSQDGEEIGLFNQSLLPVDSIIFGIQKTNISFGRSASNLNEWGYFMTPTPGAANDPVIYGDYVSNKPMFSVLGGIFESGFTLELKNTFGGTIRYTLDGSEPISSSAQYTNPLNISATTIVRASIFKDNQIPGPVITHTYFINEITSTLPVFSIVTDPDNFWDPEIGIYVQDFKPEWEIPVNIELFENNGSDRAAFNSHAGVKVNGLYSWQLPQKMLGVYFRKRYGDGSLDYPVIFDSSRRKYGNFALRASGNDWSNTLFKDAMLQLSTRYNMNLEIQDYRPTIVYVDGQYMGIHNIREKVDNDYIEDIFGLDGGTYDLIENEVFNEAGTLDAYNSFRDLTKKDLTVQANFDAVASIMDIENFTDYIITELYSRNTSLNHNIMAWKPKNSGKWRWILMDLDRGMESASTDLISYFLNEQDVPFKELFANNDYRSYFCKRLADHLYTTFHPQQISHNIDKYRNGILNEISDHIDRWQGTTSSYGNAIPSVGYWEKEICQRKEFAVERPHYLLEDLNKYGFNGTTDLHIQVYPYDAGQIKLNGLKVPGSLWSGLYLNNTDINLSIDKTAGYNFIGWTIPSVEMIFDENSEWKYSDIGAINNSDWILSEYNDASWKTGMGELGYGDGDENTIVSYEGSSSNKYITTYFRKKFNVTANNDCSGYRIYLKCDDGAIVYLNGVEIIRQNVQQGSTSYSTLTSNTIDGDFESIFTIYNIEKQLFNNGENIIAVEVHQAAANSSDISFDMKIDRTIINSNQLVSTNMSLNYNLTSETTLVALFEPTGQCVLPKNITGNYSVTSACSPILVPEDVTVDKNAVLTIEPGVEIWMSENANIYVYGQLLANGTENLPIRFTINPDDENSHWGALIFNNPNDTSKLKYTIIEDGFEGPIPVNQMAAVSAFNANLKMDQITVENNYSNPITARYSDITLTNSSLHSDVTGDLINVKYGKARVENCTFRGNDMVDADAIDYDDVEGGIIKNCTIIDLLGYNNDAVDIGEQSKNIDIDSLFVINAFDKGISFGQHSSGNVKNSTFINCDLGLGLKDSSDVSIDHCTFYNVGTPVACYEKNLGDAGGNGIVTNSILSNSVNKTYLADSKSTLSISYSISDNDSLPENANNIWANPLFTDPGHFNFTLASNSVCIGAAEGSDGLNNLGSYYFGNAQPPVVISKINYNPLKSTEMVEFLTLFNPANIPVDLSGYYFTKGLDYTFPEGTKIKPGEEIYVIESNDFPLRSNIMGRCFVWNNGKLADEGESIDIANRYGIVQDHVKYNDNEDWYLNDMLNGKILSLKSVNLDNHLPENWESIDLMSILGTETGSFNNSFTVHPNPTSGVVYINTNHIGDVIEVYSMTGVLLDKQVVNQNQIQLDLSGYRNNIVMIKIEDQIAKVVVK